jgi:hypothetical protein
MGKAVEQAKKKLGQSESLNEKSEILQLQSV